VSIVKAAYAAVENRRYRGTAMRTLTSRGCLVLLIFVSAELATATETRAAPSATLTPATLTAPAKPKLRHGVFRFSSYPAAWSSAKKSGRPILIYACSPNCPHCVRMIDETYQSPKIKRLVNESFETVYVDRAEQPETTAKLRFRFFPTTVIVGPNNQVLDVIEGYVDSKTLAARLQTSMAAHEAAMRK
jgi:thioredoxin-related protein